MKNYKISYLLFTICFFLIFKQVVLIESQSFQRNLQSTTKLNENNNLILSDGTILSTCQEYKNSLESNAINGFYEKLSTTTQTMYCLMNGQNWGLNSIYEVIFQRQDGSVDMNLTWEQTKLGHGNEIEWFSGWNHIRQQCNQIYSCELVILMTTKEGNWTIGGLNQKIFVENWYVTDESDNYKMYATEVCPGQSMARTSSFQKMSGANWSTFDRDNDTWSSGNCAEYYKGPFWYNYCQDMNPFGRFDLEGAYGFCYNGADDTDTDREIIQFDNLTYMAWLVRDYQTGGDAHEFLKGKYQTGETCSECDHTVCATCIEQATNCIKQCNEGCKTCNNLGECDSCNEGKYLYQGSCQQCQGCATCKPDGITCIIPCNDNCKTCKIDQTCDSCYEGQWLSGNICINCDDSICGSCVQSSTNCVISCNQNCKKCNVDGSCKSCNIDSFLDDGLCFQCNSVNCGNDTTMTNEEGKLQLSDGTTYYSCEEYKTKLGKNAVNDFYQSKSSDNFNMFCYMNGSEWGLDSQYEIIFQRKDGSLDMNLTWEQTKKGYGNQNEWFSGWNQIRQKCNKINSCELVILMTTKEGTWYLNKNQKLQQNQFCPYNRTVGGLNQKIFVENWYVTDESDNFKMYATEVCPGQSMARTSSFQKMSGANWSTYDRDNDTWSSGNCAEYYKGPFWYKYCQDMNPFGRFDLEGAYGFCYNGADDTDTDREIIQFDNLTYMAWLVRDYQTGGDAHEFLKGKYQTGETCSECDHTVCATCIEQATNCIKQCNEGCKTCNNLGECDSCNEGKYLYQGSCQQCQGCATCKPDGVTCIIPCNDNCKTCKIDKTCDSCYEGQWLSGNICINCDDSICGSCVQSSTNCVISCNQNCKKCNVDGSCKSCNIDSFLDDGLCIQCNSVNCGNDTTMTNEEGKLQLSDGTTYYSCEEYKTKLGKNAVNDFYQSKSSDNFNMFCYMNGSEWGLDSQYEIIFQRKDGSLDMNLTWEQTKKGYGNQNEWFSGWNQIRQKCNKINSCELVILMTTKEGTWYLNKNQKLQQYQFCPYNRTVGGLNQKIFVENWYVTDESDNFKMYATEVCPGQSMARTSSFQKMSGANWSTYDRDNDTWSSGNCAGYYKGPFWYNYCQDMNPFGRFDLEGAYGFCYNGADDTDTGDNIQFDNLTYMAWLVRDYQTGGDAHEFLKGKYQTGETCSECDHTVCATCIEQATNCIKQCNEGCKTCNNLGECDSCNEGKYLYQGSCQQCQGCATCKPDGVTCIIPCNDNCKTCKIDKTCDSCYEGQWLSGNICINCDDSICGSCVQSSTNCVISCNQNCKKCNVDGSCKSCNFDSFLDDGQCKKCNYKCKQCENSQDQCINECSHFTRNLDNQCQCKDSFYELDKQLECQACNYKCKTCIINKENCLVCKSNRSNPPFCQCQDNFYEDLNTQECYKCKYDNCNCDNYSSCFECLGEDKLNRQLPTCDCKMGYFKNSLGICQECSKNCKSCLAYDQCIECINNQGTLMQLPNCNCINGYYLDLQYRICKKCPIQCQNCIDENTCTQCIQQDNLSKLLLPDCKQLVKQDTPITIQKEISINGEYFTKEVQCQKKCLSCLDMPQNCTTCIVDKNRQNIPPLCLCKNGYHDNQGTLKFCEKCSKNCQTCSSFQKCLTCKFDENQKLNQFNQKCQCKKGYKSKNLIELQCKPCYMFKDKCLFKCPENTIINQKLKICEGLFINKKDYNSYIYVIAFIVLICFISLKFVFGMKLKLKFNKTIEIINKTKKLSIIPSKSQTNSDQNSSDLNV